MLQNNSALWTFESVRYVLSCPSGSPAAHSRSLNPAEVFVNEQKFSMEDEIDE